MRDYVLAIDPGKKTGVAFWSCEAPTEVFTYELDFDEVWEHLKRNEMALPDVIDVVIEKFVINSMTAKMSQAPWSLEVIGAARGFSGNRLIFQTPAQAKRAVSNEMLMKLRWWHSGGDGHANDALRHLVFYLMSQREPRLLAKLDELNL